MSSDRISLDLDDLDDELSQAANDFDLGVGENIDGELDGRNEAAGLTLESILNEDDDLENDEVLRSLGESLTLMRPNGGETKSESRSSSMSQQYQSLSDKNGIVCKQAPLKQISAQLLVAIERSDAGLPTALAVAQLFAIGTSRGLILLFDSQQILKLYITTDYKDAITALALNNR